jgi:DNA-binding transcriptional ArsR family regulator
MREDSQSHRSTPTEEQVDLAVEVFRMLADSTRVRVLWALLDGERPVNELAEAVDKAPAGVSQHLAKLRMARLVQTRRQANQVFYRVDSEHIGQLVEDVIYHAEHAGGGIPEHHRDQGELSELRSAAQRGRRPGQPTNHVSEERTADE